MSTVTGYRRYPLGLPAGSIRSVLLLLVVGLMCILILISPTTAGRDIPIPPYLIYLLFLIIGSFFSAHGNSIAPSGSGEPSPLYMPKGVIRLLILVGLIATVVWKLVNQPETWEKQVEVTVDTIKHQPYLPFIVLGGFFAGIIIHAFIGRNVQSRLYQDMLAWVAIISVTGMFISILLVGVIDPSLRTHMPLDLSTFEAVLAAIIAFYFAARS